MTSAVGNRSRQVYVRSPNMPTEAEVNSAVQGRLLPRRKDAEVELRRQSDLTRVRIDGTPGGRPMGVTTGLPISLALCWAYQQNEVAPTKQKLTDQEIAEWLRHEFPGRATKHFDAVQTNRWRYNRGDFTRGTPPRKPSNRYDSGGLQINPTYRKRRKPNGETDG